MDGNLTELEGREVLNVRGERLGKIDELIDEGAQGEGSGAEKRRSWARLKLGRLGLRRVIVPLENAEERDGSIALPYESEHVQRAPKVETGEGLGEDQLDQLCRHYGLEPRTPPSGIDDDADLDLPRETRDAKPPALDEGEDSPLVQRRHERAQELGLPELDPEQKEGDDDSEEKGGGDPEKGGDDPEDEADRAGSREE